MPEAYCALSFCENKNARDVFAILKSSELLPLSGYDEFLVLDDSFLPVVPIYFRVSDSGYFSIAANADKSEADARANE